jgi:hypothetical protein
MDSLSLTEAPLVPWRFPLQQRRWVYICGVEGAIGGDTEKRGVELGVGGGEWLFGIDLPETDNTIAPRPGLWTTRNAIHLSPSPLLKSALCLALFLSRHRSRGS